MKSLLLFTVAFAGMLLFALQYPEMVYSVSDSIAHQWQESIYEKRVEIAGLRRLQESELRELLPLEVSNIMWRVQGEEVLQRLRAHPFVRDAVMADCEERAWYELRCFRINVTEREPRFLAVLGEESWLVGGDGVFIVPVSHEAISGDLLRRFTADIPRATVVKGLLDETGSPAYVRGKLQLLSSILDVIAAESGARVLALTFARQREIVVTLEGRTFPITFEYPDDDIEKIREQAQRLKLVLRDLGEQKQEIRSIDLAFDRMAVVRFAAPVKFEGDVDGRGRGTPSQRLPTR